MTVLPRAITSGEQLKLARDSFSSRSFLAILPPLAVFAARLAAVPSTTDRVVEIQYDTVTQGAYTDLLDDMTLLVGSSAGASDLGLARIRLDGVAGVPADSDTIYISEESEIVWQADAYLTAILDWGLWPRHIVVDPDNKKIVYMDYNTSYTDQHVNCDPVPVLGAPAVQWLIGDTVDVFFDASLSWVIGSSITTYAWTVYPSTGVTILNGTTATPTFRCSTAGVRWAACTLTAANGKSFTGYRPIFIFDDASPPFTDFTLEPPEGAWATGGWGFRVRVYANATTSQIRERSLVVLFTRDWYGDEEISLGYVDDRTNVVCWGWITNETIDWRPSYQAGSAVLDVQGPHWWLDRITAFPAGIRDKWYTPNAWTKWQSLTINAGWFHFLHWRSTVTRMCDVFPNTDTKRMPSFEAPGAQSIWQQIQQVVESAIFARACADRYGRLFCLVPVNLTPEAQRSAIPTLQAISTSVWSNAIPLERHTVPEVGQVNLSGIIWNGTYKDEPPTPIFSLSPGHVFKRFGRVQPRDKLLLSSQAQANELAGLYLGFLNNPYPVTRLELGQNNRFVDVVPHQYLELPISSSDTVRGISYTGKVIPVAVRLVPHAGGFFTTQIDVEAETFADLAIDGDPPPPVEVPVAPPPPPPIPPVPPPPSSNAKHVWFLLTANGSLPTLLVEAGDFFGGGEPSWNSHAVPAGLAQGTADIVHWFDIFGDGSQAFLLSYSTVSKLWKTTDPTAASPTWNVILQAGDSVLGSTLSAIGGPMVFEDQLVVLGILSDGTRIHGVYDGSSWAWNDTVIGPTIDARNELSFVDAYTRHNNPEPTGKLYSVPDDTLLTSWYSNATLGLGGSKFGRWENWAGGPRYIARSYDTTSYLRRLDTDTDVLSGFSGGNASDIVIRGAYRGSHLQLVERPSDVTKAHLYRSADGASFANVFEWHYGVVECAVLNGGDTLVWVPFNVPNANEMARISTDGGQSWSNMTGNYWSDIQTDGQPFYMSNLRLTF